MQGNLLTNAKKYIQGNRKHRTWQKVVRVMACCVVFCTVYALIMPALTMEQETFCGYEEHTHSEECYVKISDSKKLICSLDEGEPHVHDSECYAIPEAAAQGHTHSEDCYTTEKVLTCTIAESEDHVHTDACYTSEETVICGLEETTVSEPELICTKPVAEGHVHSDACYETVEEPLTCQLKENEEHTHSALCYGTWKLDCSLEEHTHKLACFSNPEADVETAKVWKKTFKDVELTGVWADDVLAIAKTQIGYKESTRNYDVLEDGTIHGYTRYGDWYGSPYADWCAMFVSFCTNYAEVDGMPQNSSCRAWIEELSQEDVDLYREAGKYEPKPGDLIFFDWKEDNGDSDDLADHVGLVAELIPATETEPAKIKTIEGNSADQVKYNTYDADDTEILGYGIMPENPDPHAGEETVPYTYSDDDVQVEVRLPKDTTVPADAELKVTPIESTDDGYDAYVEQAKEAVDGSVANIALYDISFYTADGTYYPVDDTAKVIMNFVESPVDAAADVQVLHYDDNDENPVLLKGVSVSEEETEAKRNLLTLFTGKKTEVQTVVEFKTEGFSTFAVVEVTAQVVTDTTALGGRTFVLTNANSGLAMKSTAVNTDTIDDAMDDRLQGEKPTFPVKDTTLLWIFTDATPNIADDSLYYIQSAKGKYLNLFDRTEDGNKPLTLTDKEQRQIIEVVNYNGGIWLRLPGGNNGEYNSVNEYGGADTFGVWPASTPGNNELFYLTEVPATLTPVTGLAGKTFMISNPNTGVALTSNLGEYTDYAGNTVDSLRALTPSYPASNTQMLWTFSDATGADAGPGRYYIQAANGQYLHMGEFVQYALSPLTLDKDPQAIELVNLNGLVWIRLPVNGDGPYNTIDMDAAGTPTQMYVYAKTVAEPKNLFQLTESFDYTDLDGKTFAISINGNAITSEVRTFTNADEGTDITFSVEFLKPTEFTAGQAVNNTNLMWTFIDATPDDPNDTIYHIKAANGQYLNFGETREGTGFRTATLSNSPRDIWLHDNGDGTVWFSTIDNDRIIMLERFGNGNFGSWQKNSDEKPSDINNLFQLTQAPEMWTPVTDLGGKTFVISGSGKAMISETTATADAISLMKGQDFTVGQAIDDPNMLWTFTDATPNDSTDGLYNIQAANGQYLNIVKEIASSDRAVSLSGTPQEIELINYNGSVWIRVPAENGPYNTLDAFFTNSGLAVPKLGFGAWPKDVPGTANLFQLTEVDPDIYKDRVTNLDGLITAIVAVDNDNGYAAVSSTAGTDDSHVGRIGLLPRVVTKEGENYISSDEYNDLVWQFEAVPDQPGCYYIKAANYYGGSVEGGGTVDSNDATKGKYLTIAEDSNLQLSDERVDGTVIEVVPATNTNEKNAVCLRTKIGGYYFYLDLDASDVHCVFTVLGTDEHPGWATTADKANHFVLTELTSDNELDGKIVAIIAVDNSGDAKPENYAAVSSTAADVIEGKTALVSSDVTKLRDEFVCDDINNVYWEFESTGQEGHYYVKAVSFYGGTADNADKYLTITEDGLGLSDSPYALGADIEVVSASGDRELGDDTKCLRTTIDGVDYYLSLYSDGVGSDFTSEFSELWGTTGNAGNHFVLSYVNDISKLVDSLPKDSEELEALVGPVGEKNEDFGLEVQYRNAVIKKVDYLMDYFKNGTDATALEKNFYYDQVKTIYDWLNRKPDTVTPTDVNATVKVFNYDSNVNTLFNGNPLPGYRFWQDPHGAGEHSHGDDISVDGSLTYDRDLDHDKVFSSMLDEKGYPRYTYTSTIDSTDTGSANLDKLFDGTYLKGTMSNGGGLFQQDEDGYYYYYSDLNAAYFDQGDQGNPNDDTFILYDAIVRPEYQGLTSPDAGDKYYEPVTNFLPFNSIVDEDGTTNVIYDYDYETDQYVTTGSYSNSDTKPNTTYLNEPVDLWFGMSMEIDFRQPKNGIADNGKEMIFDFHGDDDVFVYIDGVLVLNLAGAHEAWDGKINFATGEVNYETYDGPASTTLKKCFMEAANMNIDNMSPEEYAAVTSVTITLADGTKKEIKFNGETLADYSSHKLNFFYMERGGNISYCGIKFNLISLPEKSLAVSKAVIDENNNPVNDQTYYTFRILQANDEGKDGKLDPFFGKDGKAMTFEIWENGDFTGNIGFVDPETGVFSLKAGQTAMFYDVLDNAVDPTEKQYIVQEVIYNTKTDQYDGVTLNDTKVTGETPDQDTTTNYLTNNPELWGLHQGDMVYTSSERSGDEDAELAYVNTVKDTSTLKITKEQTANAELENEEFQFIVLMGDERIVSAAANELDPDLSISEYAATMLDLSPIPVGTKYTVTGTGIEDKETREVTEPGIITLEVGQTATFDGLVLGTNYEVYEIVNENGKYVVESYKVVDEEDNDINDATITASSAGGEITTTGQTVKVVVTNTTYDFALNLPISKQVIGFDKENTFTFDIEEGKFNSETGEWTKTVDRPNAAITVTDGNITSGTAVLAFDSNDEDTYYFRIAEVNANGNYIYDTTVYFAEVRVGDNQATMENLWKVSGNSLTQVDKVKDDLGREEYPPVSFVNYGTYATVTKHVTGDNTGGTFKFEATVVYDSNIDYTWPEGYSVRDTNTVDGKNVDTIEFTLQNAGSVTFPLPANSNLTVTEKNPEGYNTSYQVIGSYIGTTTYGTSAEVIVTTGPVKIDFTNQPGYELPKSGGTGTYLYIMGGLLLLAAAAILLYNHTKRGKEEHASF